MIMGGLFSKPKVPPVAPLKEQKDTSGLQSERLRRLRTQRQKTIFGGKAENQGVNDQASLATKTLLGG